MRAECQQSKYRFHTNAHYGIARDDGNIKSKDQSNRGGQATFVSIQEQGIGVSWEVGPVSGQMLGDDPRSRDEATALVTGSWERQNGLEVAAKAARGVLSSLTFCRLSTWSGGGRGTERGG